MQKGIIKNVNKLTGEPIDAKDLASMLSGIIGNESGVLTVFDELRLEKISDNKVRLHSGVYSLKGHILYIPKGSYEDFEIESGTLGANRIDLLVAEYVKNGEGDGEDTLRFRIVKGKATSGAPEAPKLIQQDINENGITYQENIYVVSIQNTKVSIQSKNSKINALQKNMQNINELHSTLDNKISKIEQEKVNYWNIDKIYTNMIWRVGNVTTINLRIRQEESKKSQSYNITTLPMIYRPKQDLVQFAPGGQGYVEIRSNGEIVISDSLQTTLVEVNFSWINNSL